MPTDASIRKRIALFCIIVTSSLLTVPSAASGQASASSSVRIDCRVTDALHHEPVAGASVSLVDLTGKIQGLAATTDAAGVATFRLDRRGGPFIATARHDGYVPVGSDGYYPFQGAPVIRAGREDTDACSISLRRMGGISGSVTNPDGAPVAGVEVSVLRRGYRPTGPAYTFAGSERTGVDGTYSVAGLLPART